MRKDTITTAFDYEIESGEELIEVEFDCELHPENDGIGSYEFWGSTGYDAGVDYLVLDDIKWNKAKFTTSQNEAIERYLEDNWAILEDTITQKLYDESDDTYHWD
jgi:hypothetical protein